MHHDGAALIAVQGVAFIFTNCDFSRVDIIKYLLCHLPQVNHCQNIYILFDNENTCAEKETKLDIILSV